MCDGAGAAVAAAGGALPAGKLGGGGLEGASRTLVPVVRGKNWIKKADT